MSTFAVRAGRQQGRLRTLTAAVVAAAAAALLLGAPGAAIAKRRTTLVVGYVSAGAPVRGATLTALGPSGRRLTLLEKRAAQKTDAAGFFVLVLQGTPRSVLILATGGSARARRVGGSLQALVPHPGVDQTVFITPVSTVTAAYAARPRVSLGAAASSARRLLSLRPGDPAGEALLGVTPDFDGGKFLARARAHGGVQAYVSYLIARGRPTAFPGTRTRAGILDTLKLLGPAFTAASAVGTIGSFAYDIFKWASGSEQKIGKIWEAVQQMQAQLNAIQASINDLKADIDRGFQKILDKIGETNYNLAIRPLEVLAGVTAKLQLDFKTLVDNATAPVFNRELADRKTTSIANGIDTLENQFNQAYDLFRNGILRVRTLPAYYYDSQTLLANSGHLMTPYDSAQLDDLASYVLQYQAFAFNLIVRWENHFGPDQPTPVLLEAVKVYLGFDSAAKAKAWVDSGKPPDVLPPVPPTGDLHDELAYLETIKTVPPHTVVDELDKGTGRMWAYEPRKPTPTLFDVGRLVNYPKGLWCVPNLQRPAREDYCPLFLDAWNTLLGNLVLYGKEFVTATGLSGWEPANVSQAQSVLSRLSGAPGVTLRPSYWAAADGYDLVRGGYWCQFDRGCYVCPEWAQECGDHRVRLIDGAALRVFDVPKGQLVNCAFGVGTIHRGNDCPVLTPLVGRKLDEGEQYWPVY